jgi:hypothetical protein
LNLDCNSNQCLNQTLVQKHAAAPHGRQHLRYLGLTEPTASLRDRTMCNQFNPGSNINM